MRKLVFNYPRFLVDVSWPPPPPPPELNCWTASLSDTCIHILYLAYLLTFFLAFYLLLLYLRRFFVVEVRRGPLWSWVCCSGSAGATAVGGDHPLLLLLSITITFFYIQLFYIVSVTITNMSVIYNHYHHFPLQSVAFWGVPADQLWLGPQGPLRLVPNEADWSLAQGGSFRYDTAELITGKHPPWLGNPHHLRESIMGIEDILYIYIYSSNSVAEDD